MIVNFIAILWTLDIFYGQFVSIVVLWNICPLFGKLCQEKSGSPVKGMALRGQFFTATATETLFVGAINGHLSFVGHGKKVSQVASRVARVFLVQHTKTGKIYQMASKYTKCP
jgi:hypothetical protein